MNSQLLIYAPERQTALQRNLYGTITFVAWAVYFYLILPLLTLLLWAAGLRGSYMQLWLPEGGFDRALMVTLPLIAFACVIVLIGWAEFNRARFQNRERRMQIEDTPQVDIAAELGVEPTLAAALRDARVATLSMDEKSILTSIQGVKRLAIAAD